MGGGREGADVSTGADERRRTPFFLLLVGARPKIFFERKIMNGLSFLDTSVALGAWFAPEMVGSLSVACGADEGVGERVKNRLKIWRNEVSSRC